MTGAARPPLTPEQRAAVEDRAGSRLLAANAGSGKTAVMVERFVEAVLRDGVAVGAILALTFTEKAAAELRDRVRRRFTALGEAEHARATDGAWIGTIHGFCARVLRAQPLQAGVDPRFRVLDEPEAKRVAARAYDAALERWARAEGDPALDLAAAYGPDGLRETILGVHATLRSRGERRPALPAIPPSPRPDAAAVRAAAGAAARELGAAGDSARVAAGLAALERCGGLLGDGERVPQPALLAPAELRRGAKALAGEAAEAYRTALAAYRQACADHHAGPAVGLLAGLLGAFTDAYATEKAARAGLDFDDLELAVRDLLLAPDRRARQRWAERFALIMVDEFQDTNRLQLDVLEALERDNLFAVGDELQSIYGFRHADVGIFRARRAALGPERVRGLRTNFRSARELLDVLNATFAPVLEAAFTPLEAGRARGGEELRLFDPDGAGDGAPPVELLLTDTEGWEPLEERLGLAAPDRQPWRRAEARLVAQRLREEVDAGRRPGDVVVLVRATASLRLFEDALEAQGLPTYVVGGRGYWSAEQVRDGLAYLAVLANPRDEASLYAVLASPLCGVGADALVLLAEAGRAGGRGPWAELRAWAGGGRADHPLAALPAAEQARLAAFAAFLEAERERAQRDPVQTLLERAITATGYDLAVLRRRGGERRLANLRKLMRLAREHERAEGRDLRAFLLDAAEQDVPQAREGEAPLEAEGLDAVRLMTIHRAKGLEFPVVCVADLGRAPGGTRPPLLVGADGRVGLRLRALGTGESVPALAYGDLAAEAGQAEAEEERRLVYVAATRAEDRLILSGGLPLARLDGAARSGGPPMAWLAPAVLGEQGAPEAERPDVVRERDWAGRTARVRVRVNAPATLGRVLTEAALAPAPRAAAAGPGTALPAAPKVVPGHPPPANPAAHRLSYTAIQDHARCGYRHYLRRVLRLPPVEPPAGPGEAALVEPAAASASGEAALVAPRGVPARGEAAPGEPPPGEAATLAPAGLDPLARGTLVHLLLERLDFRRPVVPSAATVRELAAGLDLTPTAADLEDARAAVRAFVASPLRARLAAATRAQREAPFAFALEAGGGAAPLVTGALDVLARERDGTALVVDYKTDRLAGEEPEALVAREYATQRVVYALAALRGGAPRVEVAHLVLERPDAPAVVAYDAADAPALAERLAAVAADLLAERYPVAAEPHRELCGDCPGRPALCSWPETMTLRERPAPLPEEPRVTSAAAA